MKKFLMLLVVCLTMISCAKSADVSFAWDPSPSVGVTNYRLYRSVLSGSYQVVDSRDCGNVSSFTWTGINKPGTYFFVVTALDADGNESDYSNEVSKLIKLDPAKNFQIIKVVVSKNMEIDQSLPSAEEAAMVGNRIKDFKKKRQS